jgi:hypothetical protein
MPDLTNLLELRERLLAAPLTLGQKRAAFEARLSLFTSRSQPEAYLAVAAALLADLTPKETHARGKTKERATDQP